MRKVVIFGAGKIGRSFIGQVFSRSGYEVVFVDISVPVLKALNKERKYKVVFVSGKSHETFVIENVRGIHAEETDAVVKELEQAELVATCVGKNGLPYIIPTLAKGILSRYRSRPNHPLDIIIAENMRDAGHYISEALTKHLPENFPIDTYTGMVETSIGKMVPDLTMHNLDADLLTVYAEPYNTLILDKKGFRSNIPDIEWLQTKDNMKAWVDRKLFIHNFGHASAAYAGYYYYPELTYIHEVLNKIEINIFVREAMEQSANILLRLYPEEFTKQQLLSHIDDLIKRFKNIELGDTVHRVGCDLFRKLDTDDRMMIPLRAGFKNHMPVNWIARAIAYALHFRATDEKGQLFPADKQFVLTIQEKGIPYILDHVCQANLDESSLIIQENNKLSI
jgi:mannitol-1-phosphate 5-dehydrogenase